MYLLAYNVGCIIGWAYVLYISITSFQEGKSALELWQTVEKPLLYVQSAALLEILHTILGLVRAPFLATFLQVMSRVLLLYPYACVNPDCRSHWSLYLMVISWGLVEVPRYTFYAVKQISNKPQHMPGFLHWLRYSLFMILYPSGISGEILQIVAGLGFAKANFSGKYYRTILFHLALYLPLGPFMILNMWNNRKRNFRNRARALKGPRPAEGLVWPKTKGEERSTSKTNQKIWYEAVKNVSIVTMLVFCIFCTSL